MGEEEAWWLNGHLDSLGGCCSCLVTSVSIASFSWDLKIAMSPRRSNWCGWIRHRLFLFEEESSSSIQSTDTNERRAAENISYKVRGKLPGNRERRACRESERRAWARRTSPRPPHCRSGRR